MKTALAIEQSRREKNMADEKSISYLEGNCKLAWDNKCGKYGHKAINSPENGKNKENGSKIKCYYCGKLRHLKKEFDNSKLDSFETDPGDWILKVEGLRTEIEAIASI